MQKKLKLKKIRPSKKAVSFAVKKSSLVKSRRQGHSLTNFSQVPLCIDTHFHGAFGIDLMNAEHSELEELSKKLYSQNVMGFCPTTLSAPWEDTLDAVERLGTWTARQRKEKTVKSSLSHGLHLEGPFLNPQAAGAHPPHAILDFSFARLNTLWKRSQKTLKIITLAPELLSQGCQKNLVKWANQRGVKLQIGHTRANFDQAMDAINNGFHGITHAWNAMGFHHRDPGAMGAALKKLTQENSTFFVEIIPDGIHVHESLVNFLTHLLPRNVLWVSDAAPCAGLLPKIACSFGPLRVHCLPHLGARIYSPSQVPGPLAGGSELLSFIAKRSLNSPPGACTGSQNSRNIKSAQNRPNQWQKQLIQQVCQRNQIRYLQGI